MKTGFLKHPAIAAVHLFNILPLIKPINHMASRFFLTGFDTTLLIGQYFSFGYFLAIAAAMLQGKVAAIAKLQPFCWDYRWLITSELGQYEQSGTASM